MTPLLTTVLANPHDPARGVLSDYWYENPPIVPSVVLPCGQVIEPTDPRVVYRDGDAVPWGVKVTMAEWCGERCRACNGDTHHRIRLKNGVLARNVTPGTCYPCHGTGRGKGSAAAVCGAWPIAGVELADAVIHQSGGNDTYFVGGLGMFPECYWGQLDNHKTKRSALVALSHAALSFGRRAAGLPDLPGTGKRGMPFVSTIEEYRNWSETYANVFGYPQADETAGRRITPSYRTTFNGQPR